MPERFRGTQDVFVKAFFPEAMAGGLTEMIGRAQFEIAHEFAEVSGGFVSLREDVQMIGHCAVGMEEKRVLGCGCEQGVENVAAGVRVGEMRVTKVTADGHEIAAMAEIVGLRQADLLAMEWHDNTEVV